MENTVNLKSSIAWSDFKLNSDGMVPVIVQDYRTDEVLMLAYMNELAFKTTLKLGKMTYWRRSRNELWTKGLTSGHVQYVKSLTIDCDNDTILAKVEQIGAACHTGNRTCFFKPLLKKEYDDTNPLHVFQNVYDVITDRKEHPKEGSYTNYLFDKGIDKILKKVGEECTEIVIAAKNPDKEEIKYEISDFLYHMMVLMVEKQGGHINSQMVVLEREPYIAKCEGKKDFPWRVLVVSSEDRQLANNDMVYKLASSSRVNDISWIKPGKVAWER